MVRMHISDYEAHRIEGDFGKDINTGERILSLNIAASLVENNEYNVVFFFKHIITNVRHSKEYIFNGTDAVLKHGLNIENGYEMEDGIFIGYRDCYPFYHDGRIDVDIYCLLEHDFYVQLIPKDPILKPITVYLDY